MEIKIDGRYDAIQKGVEVLQKLTDGKVYFGMDGRENANVPKELLDIEGVEKHFFRGPHPSGNVRSEEHTSELQSRGHLVCRLLLEKKKKRTKEAVIRCT